LQATGTQPTFTATSVLAGTSLQNPATDRISGTVIARSQNTLTVRHATWTKPDDDFDFELADIAVNVGANTVVTEEGQMGTFAAANISVGQHIDAFGMATQATNGALTIDATAGEVRLDITPLLGTVTAMGTGSVTLNLQSLDGMPVAAFNFAGTGTSAAMDSKPTAYVVNTGMLAQTGLAVNAPARAFGFVTSFGMAPPDFTAQTLENFAAVQSDLVVDWGRAGSAMAFTGLTATSTALQLSLANVGNLHLIKLGPELIDLTKLAMPPSIVAGTAMGQTGMGQPGMGQPGMGQIFAIGHAGKLKTDNFNNFGTFVTQLAGDLAGAGMPTVVAIAATGQYDAGKNVFTAQRLVVLLSN
jgi:hypothetical protein